MIGSSAALSPDGTSWTECVTSYLMCNQGERQKGRNHDSTGSLKGPSPVTWRSLIRLHSLKFHYFPAVLSRQDMASHSDMDFTGEEGSKEHLGECSPSSMQGVFREVAPKLCLQERPIVSERRHRLCVLVTMP